MIMSKDEELYVHAEGVALVALRTAGWPHDAKDLLLKAMAPGEFRDLVISAIDGFFPFNYRGFSAGIDNPVRSTIVKV